MKLLRLIKKNIVMCIAALAALVTCCFVPPDAGYLDYLDMKTLSCLFLTLAVVCALRNIKFFTILARKIVKLTGNLRLLTLALVYITFVGSMLIANDMALITFLPLGYFALHTACREEYMAYVFILQNISANLGGMLTPFGNPQNLYLYSYFNIPTGEFTLIMLPPFLLAVAILTVCCLFVRADRLSITEDFPEKLPQGKTVLYLVLFAASLLIVFRVIPYLVGLVVIPLVLLFVDKGALRDVDYPLLLTFVFFFIFAGNLSRIPAVHTLMSGLLAKEPMLVSIASCQIISNVPSSILLSQFSGDYRALLLGVNIGGTGTIIASLASLITYSEYKTLYPRDSRRYMRLFTVMNLIFLVIMTVVSRLFFL